MNWSVSPLHSLKTRITLAVLAIFLVGIWSLAFHVSRLLHKDMERLLGEQQFSTASIVAAHVNRELAGRIETLKEVARLSAGPMQKGSAAMQSHLEQQWGLSSLFNSGTFATQVDGTAVADVPRVTGRIGVSYLDRDYLNAVLKEENPLFFRDGFQRLDRENWGEPNR